MPERPLKVEKLLNQTAKPAGSPFHSAISQNSRGCSPNSAAPSIASVASTSWSSFSYSASSRTSDSTSPASSGRARRMARDMRSFTPLFSYRDRSLDVRMRVVAFEREIFVAERKDVLHLGIDLHYRQGAGRTRQLQPRLLEMIGIKVGVAERVHEVAGLEAGHLRHHHRQQRIGRDVEGHAEEHVRGPLVELARQFAAGDVKLKQAMARRQRPLVDVRRVPGADDQPPRIRIAPDHVDDVGNLVATAPVRRRPGSPLRSVNRAEIAI